MVQDAHKPHHHVEHVHRSREGVKDHRKERDCPGDEDNIEYPEPDFSTQDDSGNHVPPPPPKPPTIGD